MNNNSTDETPRDYEEQDCEQANTEYTCEVTQSEVSQSDDEAFEASVCSVEEPCHTLLERPSSAQTPNNSWNSLTNEKTSDQPDYELKGEHNGDKNMDYFGKSTNKISNCEQSVCPIAEPNATGIVEKTTTLSVDKSKSIFCQAQEPPLHLIMSRSYINVDESIKGKSSIDDELNDSIEESKEEVFQSRPGAYHIKGIGAQNVSYSDDRNRVSVQPEPLVSEHERPIVAEKYDDSDETKVIDVHVVNPILCDVCGLAITRPLAFGLVAVLVVSLSIVIGVSVSPDAARQKDLRTLVETYSSPESLSVDGSPQSKAYKWLLTSNNTHLDVTRDRISLVQRYILAVLLMSLSGNSGLFETLQSPEPECTWAPDQIICNDTNPLKLSLHFPNASLQGSIPSEIMYLSDLVDIYMPKNQISGSLPTELGTLEKLERFDVGYNLITGTIPSELGNLTLLQDLGLNVNQLVGSIPTTLGKLTKLVYFILWMNQLTGNIPSELGSLTNIKIFSVSSNNITGTIPSTLGNLKSALQFQTFNNTMSGTIPPELGLMTNLLDLQVHNSGYNGTIPATIVYLDQLQRLRMWGNKLTGTLPTGIGNLTMLQTLNLHTNQLSGTIPTVQLVNLKQLHILYLHHNSLIGNVSVLCNENLTMNVDMNEGEVTCSCCECC